MSLTGLFADTPSKASSLLNNVEIPAVEVELSTGGVLTELVEAIN